MDHNIEWGNLYFLTTSSKGLAVIILTWNSITSFHCSCVLFMFLCKKALHSVRFWWIFLSQCTFFGEFFFSVRFGEFSVCLVTLSNFSLTAKIRCNINSTIRIVCYISKGNFRTYVCETIPYHSIHIIIIKFRVYGRVEQILVRAVGRS